MNNLFIGENLSFDFQQRFQQKQVQELTVQKKAEIFNNFDLNEPKVLASSLGAGKVRQMFDRHRGIDKSYLLQPIQHASAPATLVKKSVAPTKPARDTKISGYNSKIVVPPLSKPSYQDVNGNNKFASEIRSPLKPLASTVRPKEIRLSGTKSVTSSQSSSGKSISNGNQIKVRVILFILQLKAREKLSLFIIWFCIFIEFILFDSMKRDILHFCCLMFNDGSIQMLVITKYCGKSFNTSILIH